MAAAAEHRDIIQLLAPPAGVGAVMHLEAGIGTAQPAAPVASMGRNLDRPPVAGIGMVQGRARTKLTHRHLCRTGVAG